MNDFTTPLKIEMFYDYVERSTKFSTLESYEVEYADCSFTINKNFVSDGASIPRRTVVMGGAVRWSLPQNFYST